MFNYLKYFPDNTWNLAQSCTPQISSFYFGDYGYGNGKDMAG